MSPPLLDIAIVGAGPYGLSLAAHLRRSGRSFRIFGTPMNFWSEHMPRGMCLKSEGFASDLFDPDGAFPLRAYCAEKGLPYADIGLPVPIETFIAYAIEFQKRYVPEAEPVNVGALTQTADGFELRTASGEVVRARQVVVATGIMNFAHLPPMLASLPEDAVTHTSRHSDLSRFKGRHVAVVGAGSSAVDMAALLHGAGAEVDLVARRTAIAFHERPKEPRPLVERIKAPRSGLGIGWRSRLCTDAPTVFHAMPESLRLRVVSRHLGPAPCWFVRDAVVGKVALHLGAKLSRVEAKGGKVRLGFSQTDEKKTEIEVDHVVAGTGYKVSVTRLPFIDPAIQSRIAKVDDTPVLGRHFESSVPGLYFVGAAAANSFGPMLRFAYGAGFASRRVARRLAA